MWRLASFPHLEKDLWQPGKLKASICSTGQQRVQWPLTQICPLVNIREQAVDRGVNDTDPFCDLICPESHFSGFIKHILLEDHFGVTKNINYVYYCLWSYFFNVICAKEVLMLYHVPDWWMHYTLMPRGKIALET